MKTIVILMGFSFALALAEEKKMCPLIEAIGEHFEACTAELKTPEEILELVKKRKSMDDEKVMCYWACLLKKSEIMKDAKIQFDKLEETIKKNGKADPEKIEKIIEAFKSCKDEAEVSDNACEVTGKYGQCVLPKLHPQQ